MKNKILIIFKITLLSLFTSISYSEELNISASEVKIDKKDSKIILSGNVEAIDENLNSLSAESAKYFKKEDLLTSEGITKIVTSEKYILESKNVIACNLLLILEFLTEFVFS